MFNLPRSPSPSPRRALARGLLVGLGALLGLGLLLGGCGVSAYNGIVTRKTDVEAAWSEIQNQYKRRYDLVPQLVNTVQGAADFERTTLTEITEARASVGRVQLEKLPEDPAKLQAFLQAQSALGSALQRLLVVAENYPSLSASQNFLSLQDQLEGTENRIAVARRDYIDAVRRYNTHLRRFPTNLLARAFGFEELPQLEVEEGVERVPDVGFEFSK